MQTTQLKTTQLGQTGLEITRVGFGAWAIGGGNWEHGWRPQDDEQSIAAIHHALEHSAVDGAIVGFRSPDQVAPLVDAADLELSEGDITTIEGER